MFCSEIINELKIQPIRELSQKENSAVFTASKEDGTVFVMRIYDRETVAYKRLEGKDIPGLPKVYGCRFLHGYFVVEEEYIDGISLQEMIDGGEKMSEARTRDIISSVCGTLESLHAAGIIHRDVKPEHVMLTPEGKVYLIDLDAAMQLAPEKTSDTQLLGTAVYAAPEQFGLTRSDVRTDIYAVGILMNILLTGVHPAVEQYRSGDLAKIIAKCTEMNPASRYQDVSELLADLEHAVLSDQKAKRRRIYKIIVSACFVPLFLLGFVFFDSIYYPTVETEDFALSDSACLVCTKEGSTYKPIEIQYEEYVSSETPAQVYLADQKNRTFYILYRNNARRLELPVLDFYREKTGEKAKVQTTQNGTVKMGSIEYNIWKVEVEDAFAGAARVGISFDGSLIQYNYSDEEETARTKFLWLLDESYEEKDFLAEHDMNIIPCGEDVSGRKYNSPGGLSSSDVVLGAEDGELMTKRINMSLKPGDDRNAFYLIHPAGTEVVSSSDKVYAFGLDSSGYGDESPGGRFAEKINEEIYDYSDAGTVSIAGKASRVTKVTLKKYLGHEKIETTFGLVNAKTGNAMDGFAGIRLIMGLNLVIEAENGDLPSAEAAGLNRMEYVMEKAAGFEPETKPLTFSRSADGRRYEAFFPDACALISDEGIGRFFTINASVQEGWEISDITDRNGKPAAYTEEKIERYFLLDENGKPVYSDGEIVARGWRYGVSGVSVKDESRNMMDRFRCVKSRMEDYASGLKTARVGDGNAKNFDEFIKGKDRYGNPVKVEKILAQSCYVVYLNPVDDTEQNEIVFKMKRTAA